VKLDDVNEATAPVPGTVVVMDVSMMRSGLVLTGTDTLDDAVPVPTLLVAETLYHHVPAVTVLSVYEVVDGVPTEENVPGDPEESAARSTVYDVIVAPPSDGAVQTRLALNPADVAINPVTWEGATAPPASGNSAPRRKAPLPLAAHDQD
jgi:hypothetical protein